MDHPLLYTRPVGRSNPVSKLALIAIANITGIGGWSDAMERTKAFVAELTLDEKADMVTGTPGPCNSNIVAIPRLGFPDLYFQDGPLAVRIAYYAPAFPAGVAAAAS